MQLRCTRKWQMFLLDLLYPNRCPCCHKSIVWNQYLCEQCQSIVETTDTVFCPRCGKSVEHCLCGTGLSYDRALVVTAYADVGRAGVLSLKTAESLQFAYYCGALLGNQILADPELHSYDWILPVPMAKRKKRTRLCNPAEILAREIAAITKIPIRTDIFTDTGTGISQHTLSASARRKNTTQFLCKDIDLTGYRILLCDDVITTGSTLNRCAGLLKEHGTETVSVAVMTSTCCHRAHKPANDKTTIDTKNG